MATYKYRRPYNPRLNQARIAATAQKKTEWIAANEGLHQWLSACALHNDFARSLIISLGTYGTLTEKQFEAATRMKANSETRLEEKRAIAEDTKLHCGDGANKIKAALVNAKSKGIKHPKLRTSSVNFTLAPETGKNPGCIYINAVGSNEWLGKIDMMGMFYPSRTCTEEQKQLVAYTSVDPLAAAVAYGRMSGQCSCCGKRLDDPKSIELGIGPVCIKKYFE